jgi:ATP-dependent RNA helicase RhlE
MKVKEVKDHPYPWNNEATKEGSKPDLRNKKKKDNSRKSTASKKNKKRWY